MRKRNDIIVGKEHAILILRKRDGTKCGEAIVDTDDVERVSSIGWSIGTGGYIYGRRDGKTISLHRFIMSPSYNLVVDHKNHNLNDNRKRNLRTCTRQQNIWNSKKKRTNQSGVKGVYFFKPAKLWRADIQGKEQRRCLGYFKDKESAAKAYADAVKQSHGEFAYEAPI